MVFSTSLKICSFMALKPGEGARALRFHDLSRRAKRVVGRSDAVLHRFGEAQPSRNGCIVVRPYPAPGPPPFIPNAFLMCEALTGFDSCWAASKTKESELGEEFLLTKKKLRPIQILLSATRPNTNQMPSGICTAKRRLWVDGDGAPGKGQSKVDPLIWTRQPLCIK